MSQQKLTVRSFSLARSIANIIAVLVGGLLPSDGLGALPVSQDEEVAPDVCAAPHLADLLRLDCRVVAEFD